MSLLGHFEQRLESAVEGFFARLFRSGVHPVEIGKRILRVMEDGKTVGLRHVYVPWAYQIVLSRPDYERLAPLEAKLVEELEIFISEAARQRDWELAAPPRVTFVTRPRLSPGEFRVEADAVVVPASADAPHPSPRPAVAAAPSPGGGTPARALRSGPVLHVLSDGEPIQTVEVGDRLRIGRQPDNDLVLPDPGVSRHHAEVVREGGSYILRDLGSTNGTAVNGARIREHRLQDGDRVVLGQTVVEFRRS